MTEDGRRWGEKGTRLFREVNLPDGIRGRLFLYRMPGRGEPLESAWDEASQVGIKRIVSLAGIKEIRAKSPDYARAIEQGIVPVPIEIFGIPDFGVPKDRNAFLALACEIAQQLTLGANILIHCGGGVGRTGIFATAVLLALGVAKPMAETVVKRAGSKAEMPGQWGLVAWCASRFAELA